MFRSPSIDNIQNERGIKDSGEAKDEFDESNLMEDEINELEETKQAQVSVISTFQEQSPQTEPKNNNSAILVGS